MFGGREVVRSDLDVGLQIRTKKALMALSQLVTHSCESAGVGRRKTPFGRASNFIVVLEPDILHLVVDTAHVSAMPTHTYVDRRAKDHRRDLEGMLAHSKRSLGFARPFGVSLPLSVLQVEGEDLESQLTAVASSVCSDLLARVRMEHMGIPDWFQPLSQAFGAFLGDHPHPEKNVNLMIAGTGGDWAMGSWYPWSRGGSKDLVARQMRSGRVVVSRSYFLGGMGSRPVGVTRMRCARTWWPVAWVPLVWVRL